MISRGFIFFLFDFIAFNWQSSLYVGKVRFDVTVDGKMTEEKIEMNFEQNYVRVTTPAFGLAHAIVLVHDYSKVDYYVSKYYKSLYTVKSKHELNNNE